MAIQDKWYSEIRALAETVEKARREIEEAVNAYGRYYIGRISEEQRDVLKAMLNLLYIDNAECLREDFQKAVLPEEEISRMGKHDRMVCLIFLLRGLQCYLGEECSVMAEFANELATGKYSMENLPYPE